MTEDKAASEARTRQDAEQLERRVREDAEHMETRFRQDPRHVREWLRQNNLIYGGLIGIGVIIMQPFLTASSLDLPATISVVAFALAIPLLAALILLNEEEAFRRRPATSRFVDLVKGTSQGCAYVGVVAAFWHITWMAGVGVLAASIVGLAVHTVGYVKLQADGIA